MRVCVCVRVHTLFAQDLELAKVALDAARPTAVNLSWATEVSEEEMPSKVPFRHGF